MHDTKINGWIILDKPENISSAHALKLLKKSLKPNKIGHTGTLDPIASGLLIVAVGEATKLSDYAMSSEKKYEFSIEFGSNTDTFDRDGTVTATTLNMPTLSAIQEVVKTFSQNSIIMQRPPIYSAIHVDGKRAYDLARTGQLFEIPPRPVYLKELQFLSLHDNIADFTVTCGKGFYVRSLAQEIVNKLTTCGHIRTLRRTQVGKFDVHQAITLCSLSSLLHNTNQFGTIVQLVKPVTAILDDILVLHLARDKANALRNGRAVLLECGDYLNDHSGEIVVCDSESGVVVAICSVIFPYIKPRRVFNIVF